MFEQVGVKAESHRGATVLAFTLNTAAIMAAIVLPMIHPERLPAFSLVGHVSVPYSAPRSETQAPPQHAQSSHQNQFFDGQLHPPGRIPNHIDMSHDEAPAGDTGPVIPGAPLGNRDGVQGMPWLAANNPPPVGPAPKPVPRPTILHISQLDPGALVKYVQPIYPPIARATHIQGEVLLSAVINKNGEIVGVQVLRGSPLLTQAAVAAVEQWRYRPYILNGDPIEVRTEITVHFQLQ